MTLKTLVSQLAPNVPASKPVKSTERDDDTPVKDPESLPPLIPWRPFPVEVLPPVVMRFVVEMAAAIGCDPAFVALPALSVLAACIGNTRRVSLKRSWSEPSVIWTATIAPPSSLKSPAWQAAMDPLLRHQQSAFASYAESQKEYETLAALHEKDMTGWKRGKCTGDPPLKPTPPICQRFITSDATVEAMVSILADNPRGVIYSVDELAGWLQSLNQYKGGQGGDLQAYLSMHRAGPVTTDRKTGQRITHIPRAAVSVCGTIQPGLYERLANSQEFRESGLMTRLLVARPPVGRKRWTDADISEEARDGYTTVVESLLSIRPAPPIDQFTPPEPIVIPLTRKARAAWIEFYNQFASDQAEADETLAGHFGKIEAYAARFALLFALIIEPEADVVDIDAMESAITLARWFAHEASRVTAATGESDEERERRQLIEFVERQGGEISVRDLARSSRRYRRPGEAEKALTNLVVDGLGTWETETTASKPRTVFRLSGSGDGDKSPENQLENHRSVTVASVTTDQDDDLCDLPPYLLSDPEAKNWRTDDNFDTAWIHQAFPTE